MKSDFFNKLIKDSTTGSVRQTLHFEKLAAIKAPVPNVSDQQIILDAYHAKLNEAEENIKMANDYSDGLLPVSYTHLDVYKRQQQSTL